MSSLVSAAAATLSFASLVLVAIAMATNSWVRFDYPRPPPPAAAAPPVNAPVSNPKLPGLVLTYDLDHVGLWVGCHRERAFNKTSCAFVGSSCYSDVCWTRNRREKACLDARVAALAPRCAGYRATRALAVLGTLCLILGAAVLLVSVCVTSRNLVLLGTVLSAAAALALMVAFAVFYSDVFRGGRLHEVAALGWSFILLVVAWPLAVVASVVGMLAAFLTPSKAFDYADSE